MNSRDGYAIQYAAKLSYIVFIITGGDSKAVENRLLNLGVKEIHLKASDKLSVYNSIKLKHGLTDSNILYMGDDLPDYQVLQKVGVSACPQDAAVEIKAICDYQSPFNGGKHCVRDVIEQTLRVQEKWNKEEAHRW